YPSLQTSYLRMMLSPVSYVRLCSLSSRRFRLLSDIVLPSRLILNFLFLSIYFPPPFPLTIEGDKTLCFWDILLKKYFRPSSWILLYYLFVEMQLLFSYFNS